MKKVRELLDVQMEEIHKELLQAGVGGPVLSGKRASGRQREDDLPQAEQLSPATPTELIASAFQLAGYVVATLALGRSIPAIVWPGMTLRSKPVTRKPPSDQLIVVYSVPSTLMTSAGSG